MRRRGRRDRTKRDTIIVARDSRELKETSEGTANRMRGI